MHRTRVDWADCEWNPITGCLHSCDYCYAKKQATRFSGDIRLNLADERCQRYELADDHLRDTTKMVSGEHSEKPQLFVLDAPFVQRNDRAISYPFGFAPTFHKYRLDNLGTRKNGANIYVGSMADMFGEWVPDEWIQMVFDACAKYPQHNYLFLTKNPDRYLYLAKAGKLPKGENMWYGSTVTDDSTVFFSAQEYNCFISIEPMLSRFDCAGVDPYVDWVIVGAETGNRKGKVTPEKQWIDEIAECCADAYVPLFMKESLVPLMGDSFAQTLPKQLSKEKPMGEKSASIRMDCCMQCKEHQKKAGMRSITVRRGRNGANKTIGFLCDKCFDETAEKWGVDCESLL